MNSNTYKNNNFSVIETIFFITNKILIFEKEISYAG